ncbi:Palmitoyltransferase ZDHHC2 [Orchesella cincta]|uniref:Palmitoyltransferase ZDHHC2 n=1 Tax=Orchesella cincta TaxID=48709 RepID=A0A1D2MQS8_ORCCI|nr:Palmitoyltransferase ZDHHC2 [Orchesella cincta]
MLLCDHHCPWEPIVSCFTTTKFFILFLAYAFPVLRRDLCNFISILYRLLRGGWDAPMQGRFHILFVFVCRCHVCDKALCSLCGVYSLLSLAILVTRNRVPRLSHPSLPYSETRRRQERIQSWNF